MNTVIEVEHLSHRYGDRLAVDDLSFHVPQGEILALLGPNGAGKTTTIRLLNGLFKPFAGKVRILGLDPFTQGSAVRERTGVLTETPALYERLTARQNLNFFATLDGMSRSEARSRSEATLQLFDLKDRADSQVGSFSKGMKQRLALGRALLSDPALLFLDEPTSGLDPEAARGVHDLIRNMRTQDGHSLLLCTHHLEEAEALCDRVAILNRGSLVALGTLDELRRDTEPGLRVKVETLQPFMLPSSGHLPGALEVNQENPTNIVVRVQAEDAIPGLVDALVQKGARILSIQPLRPSLADIYFKLQGEQSELNGKVK